MKQLVGIRNVDGILPEFLISQIVRRNPELHYYGLVPGQSARLAKLWEQEKKSFSGLKYIRTLGDKRSERQIYDAELSYQDPGVKARYEGEPAHKIEDVNLAYEFGGNIRKFLMDVHGRNGIDSHGILMEFVTRYGDAYPNAFWNGKRMYLGSGDKVIFKTFNTQNVNTHEVTHGVTEYVCGAEYYGQSGALNEHWSDAWACMLDQWLLKQFAKDASWLIGEGIFVDDMKGGKKTLPGRDKLGAALRDMLEPGTGYNDSRLGRDPQPGHMKDYIKTSSDNGGVHSNSGIPNHWFALFCQYVGGYSWEKAGQIWYSARAASGSKPSFAQFAQHCVNATKAMFPSELGALRQALNDVGVVPSFDEVDTLTPPLEVAA